MRSKIRLRTQRRNRLDTEFQWPNSAGRSRQGNPARARHSTASRNSRLSFAVTPRSDFLPGNRASIFCQTVSLTTNLARSINPSLAQEPRWDHASGPKEPPQLSTDPNFYNTYTPDLSPGCDTPLDLS